MGEQGQQNAEDQAEPELLYHYTTEEGLYGILKNDSIWATHYRFTNDTTERQGALDFIMKELDQLRIERKIVIFDEVAETFKKSMNGIFQLFDTFLVSFTRDRNIPEASDISMEGDRLSQWRGYALSGSGYSLGFQEDRLKKIKFGAENKSDEIPPINLSQCMYLNEDKIQKARRILQDIFLEFQSRVSQEKTVSGDAAVYGQMPVMLNYIDFCARFKHLSFREENESRMSVYIFDEREYLDKIKYRDGKYGRIPYVEIRLGLKKPDCPLKRIVVGPSPNRDQAVVRLRIELKQMGIHGVEVVPSKIPYRNW
jgi:hypothetical protein